MRRNCSSHADSLSTQRTELSPMGRAHPVNPMLEAALDYTRQGFVVFPCLKKKPLTERGLYDASKHESQIRRWWSQNPEAQIALPTGVVNGFFALDIDNASAA